MAEAKFLTIADDDGGFILVRHPLSTAWGDIEPDQLQELIDDVTDNGLLNPITMFEGQVLDGWHRANAAYSSSCDIIEAVEFEGSHADAVRFVISQNARRRHRTKTEIAEAVARCMEWRPRGMTDQHVSKQMTHDESSALDKGESDDQTSTIEEMADLAGVSRGTMNRAVRNVREERGEVEPQPDKPAAPPKSSKTQQRIQRLEDQMQEMIATVAEKDERIEDLEQQVQFLENEGSEIDAVRESTFNNLRADIKTLRTSSQEWQAKYSDVLQENKHLERQRDHLERQNLKQRQQIASLKGETG